MTSWIVLIPLLPLAAFIVIALFGSRLNARSHWLSVPAFSLSFLLSVAAVVQVARHGPLGLDLYSFLHIGRLTVDVGLYLDALSALVLLLVTGVSTLVHLFSSRYMQGDPRYARFFAVISLFAFAMIMVVMSTNLMMLYFYWEIMGLCSYLLVSHQAERPSAAYAATRVFLTNAVADIGLGLAVLLCFTTFGTLNIQEILAAAPSMAGETVNLLGWLGLHWRVDVITMIALLFFFGAMGKSAQFPLHVWLPFAMEAPTPVSALIHAATLVKAGVFLMVRMSPLVVLAPAAMVVMMVIGGATALLAGAIALTQNDIKRILAYSTMSQLGLMMFTCGAGAFIVALFHLLAHGVVKAYLFLSSGSALEQLAHHQPAPQPLRRARTFVSASLVGIVALAGLLVAMWIPFSQFVQPAVADGALMQTLFGGNGHPYALLVIGLIYAAVGWGLSALAPFHSASAYLLIRNKLYLDEIYDRFVVGPTVGVARWLWRIVDVGVIERITHGCGTGTITLARHLWLSVDVRLLGWAVQGTGRLTIATAHWLWQSVDIRALGWAVDGPARATRRVAHWLWRSVDIRGLEWLVAKIGRQQDTTGKVLREIEPSMLQHQLLVMIFTLVILMILFLIHFS